MLSLWFAFWNWATGSASPLGRGVKTILSITGVRTTTSISPRTIFALSGRRTVVSL